MVFRQRINLSLGDDGRKKLSEVFRGIRAMLANESMYLKCFFQILFCGLTIQILLGLQTMEDRMPNLRANVFYQKCSVDR